VIGLDSNRIELGRITEPATVDDVCVVKLTADGCTYECHSRNEDVTLVSTWFP
jgi:hypothetical protein